MLANEAFEGVADALDHHVDALGPGRPRQAAVVAVDRVDAAEALLVLTPQDAVGLARVLFAQPAVLTDLERPVADGGSDDLRGLVGAAHEAGVERRGVAQLAAPFQSLAQQLSLGPTVVGQALAQVTGDDLLGVGERLAVANENDPRHRRLRQVIDEAFELPQIAALEHAVAVDAVFTDDRV